MKKITLLLLCLIVSSPLLSQTFEFGPSVQYHRTAFQFDDEDEIIISDYGISEGTKVTEADSNIAFGGYAAYYTENTFAYIAELFYVTTSSPNYGNNKFNSINLIPSVAAEMFNSNLFINAGLGAGFLLNKPDFEDIKDVEGKDYSSVDILLKLALNYRIKNVLTIDGGALFGAIDIVDEQHRFHYYLGARVPLNVLIK
jgi:hypothetical protein|tara:strand:+ start:8721 stop:9317 length:597 start_codon:yes stop_codon:yes gene_type:complete